MTGVEAFLKAGDVEIVSSTKKREAKVIDSFPENEFYPLQGNDISDVPPAGKYKWERFRTVRPVVPVIISVKSADVIVIKPIYFSSDNLSILISL